MKMSPSWRILIPLIPSEKNTGGSCLGGERCRGGSKKQLETQGGKQTVKFRDM